MGRGSGSGGRTPPSTGYLKGGDRLSVTTSLTPAHHRHHDNGPQHARIESRPSLKMEKPRFRPKGLTNVGNTCYANAVLQCLLSTALTQALMDPNAAPVFRQYSFNLQILQQGSGSVDSQDSDEDKISKRRSARVSEKDPELQDRCVWLTNELKKVTLQYVNVQSKHDMEPSMSESLSNLFFAPKAPVVNPQSITRHPHRLSTCLRPYQQEDAHEFLRALLGTLGMNGRNRELHSLFDGLLESSITCAECGKPSLTRDRYMDLSLDIADGHIETLEDALEQFTQEETLSGDNKVHCTRCDVKRTATKALRLATAPSVLVLHLKRFAFNPLSFNMVRLGKKVKFPMHLEISDYMSNLNQARPPSYELVAVLVHQGQRCEAGHYVAFVKSEGEWFCCNDNEVTAVPVEKVMRQQAYILMYEVAEMREKHGFPSPSAAAEVDKETGKPLRPNQFSFFNNLLCGADDALVQNMCCVLSSTNPHQYASHTSHQGNHRSRNRRARDDGDLESQISQLDCDQEMDLSLNITPGKHEVERPTFRKSNSTANLRNFPSEREDVSSPNSKSVPSRHRCFSGTDSDPGFAGGNSAFSRPPRARPSSCRPSRPHRALRAKSIDRARLPPRHKPR
eukprot:CAMPEP_0168740984 /NCGR_PEP_ID=MMETSP0724-20121128/12268_1 /TAXON_ID=265536 /ORGANISM="Amphiprora sp., Strain CCMP467" /LENGTH=621 /DNA_ID=CAMNT_0008788451 /DNA_START=246 /DNA_END=2107 /DNA_ORIENTATION=-